LVVIVVVLSKHTSNDYISALLMKSAYLS